VYFEQNFQVKSTKSLLIQIKYAYLSVKSQYF